MASNQMNPGQTHGQAQAKTEDWMESAKSNAHSAIKKAENATQNEKERAQHEKDQQDPGFFQQTREDIANMTQGAIDGVKNTFGIGDKK